MTLTTLFMDMNAYFASVEQQLRPELRGRPVVVAAVDADSTCCIAASYEAKRLGIRTGTPVWEALERPGVKLVVARPAVYVHIHHAIVAAVESCLPVKSIHSIDEMSCRLSPDEREPAAAIELAKQVKNAIYRHVGEHLKCSIGLAPNRFLAKVASDLQKPDGLTVISSSDLPHILYPLKLDDLAGIGRKMLLRFNANGVHTVERLCELSEAQLKNIWGGVIGRRWWYWLRGYDLGDFPTHRSTVGHSHVLPPGLRSEEGARAVLIRLIHKAAVRLRKMHYWARRLSVYISYTFHEQGWEGSVALGHCQDTLTMIEAFNALWRHRPTCERPTQVAITLYDLVAHHSATQPLFRAEQRRIALAQTMDKLNYRFGVDTVYFAGMHQARDTAPMRIAFSQIPDL